MDENRPNHPNEPFEVNLGAETVVESAMNGLVRAELVRLIEELGADEPLENEATLVVEEQGAVIQTVKPT